MATFPPLPLGQRIPSSVHAVSCSLPTMRDVRGYEEKDPEIIRQLTSGYPRFVVHPFTLQLADHFVKSSPTLHGRTLWFTTGQLRARQLFDHVGGTAAGAELFERDGVHGISHLISAGLGGRAKTFLQNIGGFLSSREAEDHLVRLKVLPASYPETTFPGDAQALVLSTLRTVLPGTRDADLFLAPSGMSSMHAAFRACADLQASRGRTVWVQLGWLYLDTIAILKKFTRSAADYVYVRDPLDQGSILRIFQKYGSLIAGVVAEVPTNPLIQTPDLIALSKLCGEHGAKLIVDPSIASIFNLNVLPHADVISVSLTKYAASEGDVIAGLCAVNPDGPDADELRRRVAAETEPLYSRDLSRLAYEIGQVASVLSRIHHNTAQVAAYLENHPRVREVVWALHPASRENFLRIARSPEATGGMITFTLRGDLSRFYDRLRLPKGPSFGMTTTLICPFMYLAHYDLVTTPAGMAELAGSRLDPDLLRLCCGVEPAEDIIAALAEALED
ncbi:MAG: PLP-dependent transferase [Opitutus sp.]